jgi:hypothetical protein
MVIHLQNSDMDMEYLTETKEEQKRQKSYQAGHTRMNKNRNTDVSEIRKAILQLRLIHRLQQETEALRNERVKIDGQNRVELWMCWAKTKRLAENGILRPAQALRQSYLIR